MSRVIAALDSSPTARDVVLAARALSSLFGGDVHAVHVREDGTDMPTAAAKLGGLRLRVLSGPVVQSIVRLTREAGVGALVIGARRGGSVASELPAGGTALQLIGRAAVPVVVVPPGLPTGYEVRRVLVPLDATHESAAAVREVVEMACAVDLDVVLLHVFDERTMPRFDDQAQYEAEEWAWQFRDRFCPDVVERVTIETRTGGPADKVVDTTREVSADLLVLGWGQDLSRTAAVVRAALRRCPVPILLVPVRQSGRGNEHLVGTRLGTGRGAS